MSRFGVPLKQTTSWMVLLGVSPILIPCPSQQQVLLKSSPSTLSPAWLSAQTPVERVYFPFGKGVCAHVRWELT